MTEHIPASAYRSMRRGKPRKIEAPLHIAILEYLRDVLSDSHIVFHPANGGHRSKAVAAEMKRMGVMAGIPDLAILRPAGRIAWIEVKPEGEYLSLSQKAFKAWCEKHGVPFAVCRSIDDARDFIEDEGMRKRENG